MGKTEQKQNKGRGADPARKAAVQALVKLHGGMYANLAVKGVPAALPPRDRAFAGALFYGTAERLVPLDAILQPFLKKPLPKMDAEVRAILECGLYQLLYMQVPASAAVNEAVTLTRALGKSSAAGLVNAVLRRAGGADPAALPYKDETERVCIQYSVSAAVAGAVMQALPEEYDAFFKTTLGSTQSPSLTLRANTLKTTAPALAQALQEEGAEVWPVEQPPLPAALKARLPHPVDRDGLFLQGHYHIQGLASQYACACLAVKPGHRVLDLCAAPGGKSATLAQALGGGKGLTACDIHGHRVQLINSTLARLGIQGATVLQNDATVYTEALAGQDRILCDVPCSGLGVLAKKPDLRYADGAGWPQLAALQLQILGTAARYLVPGGRMVYSTCTIRPEENEQIVRKFLQNNEDFKLAEMPGKPPKGAIAGEYGVTLLPQATGLDGFFVASLERLC